MASTYSTNLKIELIGTGEQTSQWGNTTNDNFGIVLEEAIVGYGAVQFTNDANLTLTLSNSNASQTARKFYLRVTSTVSLSARRDLIVPTIEKTYTVENATTGGQAIRVKTSAGTGVVVPSGKKMLLYVDGANVVEQINYATNLDIGTLNISSPLPLVSGGTGAATASVARSNLGLGTIATQAANNVAITGGSITGITDLAVADGGTGASDAAGARTNLGLGTISTQNANSVSITGGSITGITDLAIADGGTGASDASTARINLGLGSMATQNSNAVSITGGSLSGVTAALTGTPTAPTAAPGTNTTQIATTAFVQNVAGGLGTMSSQNANAVNITGGSITGITDLAIADGGTGASTAANARTNLGLGTIATQNSNAVSITGGSISGITDLAVADGGTGASDAAGARTNLGVPSTTGSGASGTWGISITGNAATATTANNALGVGQTWQNVTGSRSMGVTYTNTTGRTIVALVNTAGDRWLQYNGTISGISFTWHYAGDFGGVSSLTLIIPNNATYSVTSIATRGGTASGPTSWLELR